MAQRQVSNNTSRSNCSGRRVRTSRPGSTAATRRGELPDCHYYISLSLSLPLCTPFPSFIAGPARGPVKRRVRDASQGPSATSPRPRSRCPSPPPLGCRWRRHRRRRPQVRRIPLMGTRKARYPEEILTLKGYPLFSVFPILILRLAINLPPDSG